MYCKSHLLQIACVLDPETAKIPQFLDPEIVEMDKKNSGSRNCKNGAVSGYRNCRNDHNKISGSRNRRNGAVSGSRNRRNTAVSGSRNCKNGQKNLDAENVEMV